MSDDREPTPPVPDAPTAEPDERFPSGKWTGFFLQPSLGPGRFWMELILQFKEGGIVGEGRDKVGEFVVRGHYELSTGKCGWTKRYVARHDVSYQGFNEGKGIWGTWDLIDPPHQWRGGFHIWPEGLADPTAGHKAAEAEAPAEPAEPPLEPAALPEAETVGAGEGAGAEVPA